MARSVVRRFAWIAGVLAIVASPSARQNPSQEPDAELVALLAAARESFTDNDWDRGGARYEALLTAARAKGSELFAARAMLGLGQIASQRSQYADARQRALEALAIFERLGATGDIGDANRTLAIIAGALIETKTEQAHFERAAAAYREAGNESARVEATFRALNAGSVDTRNLASYRQVHAEAQAVGDKLLEGQILHSWGDLLFLLANYEEAIEKLEAAAVLFQELGTKVHLGTTYNSLGRLYRAHGQPAAGLQFQLKALEIHQTTGIPRFLIQSLNAVGVASQVLGNDEQARHYYESALAVAKETGVPSFINFITANLGSFLVDTESDIDRGREYLERAIAAGAGYATSGRYAQLSDAYRKLGRYQDSFAAAEQSLKACVTPTDCINARAAETRTHLAVGNDAAALANQREILAAVEKLHATVAASDLLRQDFQRLWEQPYTLAIDLHFRRGEFREALEAAELARSRAFLDLMASRERQRPTQSAVSPAAGPAGEARPASIPPGLPVRGAPAAASGEPPSVASTLRSNAAAPLPTLEGLTAIATRLHSTLLAYWVSATHIYVWALSPDGAIRGASVSISRSKLDELIRASAALGRTPDAPQSRPMTIATRGETQIVVSGRSQRTWRALYDLLIAPIERELPRAAGARLTIVPYGPLLDVPFAALRDARGRYLIERYTLHSVPAGSMLQYTAGMAQSDARRGSALLIGDPAGLPRVPGEPPLPRLAGAGEEVRTIARLLPAARTTVLAGAAATEPLVRANLAGKDIIHFATHGIVRDGNPLSSFLALGTGGGADGRLTADKIYGLDLDANLIVLSACRSGGGVITGDGIAGLARAFFYAGTASLIVSVWDVADQPTNRLLPAFYRHWLKGADKASALRAAQLELIRGLRAGDVKVTLPAGTFVLPEDPAFWAAFVLLGEPD